MFLVDGRAAHPYTHGGRGVEPQGAPCWGSGRAGFGRRNCPAWVREVWTGAHTAAHAGPTCGPPRLTGVDAPAPPHPRTNHRAAGHPIPPCGSASMARVDDAHPHKSHRTDHPAPTCGSPCMMEVDATAQTPTVSRLVLKVARVRSQSSHSSSLLDCIAG